MSKTVSNTITNGLVLTAAYNPLSITGTGAILSGKNASAIYGSTSQPWQIFNAGLVNGQQDYGIQLQSSGTVANSGTIVAGRAGAQAVHVKGTAGVVTNSGGIFGGLDGVVLTGGGTVGNTGTILGTGNTGVYIGGGAGTVTNAGSIGGGVDAVQFVGSFADLVVLDPGAVFQGAVQGGSGSNTLELAAGTVGDTGTLSGFGTSFTHFGTIIVDTKAKWLFDVTNTIGSQVTLIDQGTLANAGVINTEVTVAGGGTVTNAGTISAVAGFSMSDAVYVIGGAGTVTNSGTIKGLVIGVDLSKGGDVFNGGPSTSVISSIDEAAVFITGSVGTVTNAGTIIGYSAGVYLGAGGSVGNTGTISASGFFSYGVKIIGGGVVSNSGAILVQHRGVYLSTGTVVNTGYIGAIADDGIYVRGGTVVNAGTIVGSGTAIKFGGSSASRLIVDPGAIFTGVVQGGSGSNTLELAAGTTGATGTLSGIGTSFTSFGTIIVDSDAKWAVFGAASGTLENAGLLSATVTIAGGGTVLNTGTIDAGVANYGITLQAGGTVSNSGRRALIEGSRYGIRAAVAAATIANGGSILGTSGLDGGGVGLYAGGTVTNLGAINGAGNFGVYITGGAATVTNAGSIGGASGAVYLKGSTTNRVIFDPGAVFRGAVTGGSGSNTLELATGTAGATGTLSGFGTGFTNFGTLAIDSGANWQLDVTNTIGSQVTLIDQGKLANAGVINTEVTVAAGGSVSNTGTINAVAGFSMPDAVYVIGGAGTVTNTGSIKGLVNGVDLSKGGDVFNGGPSTSVISAIDADAVLVTNGVGTVTNESTISGYEAGVYLGAGGSVSNTGIINASGFLGYGVELIDGGVVNNSGSISAQRRAVYLSTGTVVNTGYIGSVTYDGVYVRGGTVVNAGTIVGSGTAIKFGGSSASRLIVNPGAVFTGAVQGGSGSNTLELAAGTTGATGTLSNFGHDFTSFRTIIVDPGAKWQFDSSDTIASGVSLADGGVFLGNAGAIDTIVTLTASGSFANTGTVAPGSSAKYAVTLQAGGVVSNAGTILASFPNKGQAVRIDGGAGTLGNTGTILGGGDGVVLTAGGTVTNSGSIRGTSNSGVYIGGGPATVTNAGTIGGGNDAVYFSGNFADRMILDPGAVLQGTVHGGSGTNTLELAAGTAAAAGTLSAFGSAFTSFGSIILDSGADWELDGASPNSGQTVTLAGTGDLLALGTPGSFADAIHGFGPSDTLDLTGLAFATGAAATLSGNALTVSSGGIIETFTLTGIPSGTGFQALDDDTPADGTLVEEVLCFLRGTRILTPGGEVAVEHLRIGDEVCLHDGGIMPIRWIGRGSALVTAGTRSPATPVIIRRGALGPNVPHTDLHVTKGHALYLGGALIPAEFLINHRSILWDDRAREVEVFHIEVAENQVLLANGAPAETYRDEGNRWMFRNGRPGSAQGEATVWDRPGVAPYAPVLTGGPLVDAVWAELLARAGPRIPIPTTDDPDLHLLVDGVRLDGQMMGDGRWVFRLSHAPREVVIASRAGRQDELGRQRDPRLLGVALSQIVLWDSPNPEIIEADHPELRDGFHAYEADGGIIWTNGHAVLPELCRPRRAGHLHLYVRHTAHYPYPEEARAAA